MAGFHHRRRRRQPHLFPYWVKPLGMDDAVLATFAVIDWKKNKLTIAPAAIALTGDAQTGWTLSVDHESDVFPFLKKNSGNKIYMRYRT